MSWDNPYGKPAFTDLDYSWYEYMKADRKERKKLCEDMMEIEAIVTGIFAVIGIVVVIIGLAKGWF